MSCCKGTKGQATRNWLRREILSNVEWHVGISLLFTFLHDIAGFFSASGTLIERLPGDIIWLKLAMVYIPIVIFDCGSELLFVIYHDIPLCEGEFDALMPDGKTPIGVDRKTRIIMRVALCGQILTALSWLALLCTVGYFAIFQKCDASDPAGLAKCNALVPGINEVIVIFMVLIKNSMMLKEYSSRALIYPVICTEQLLFLHHLKEKQGHKILESFAKFHALAPPEPKDSDVKEYPSPSEVTADSSGCCSFWDSYEFNVGFNFAILLGIDIASLASVSTIIIERDSSITDTVLRALPFIILLVVDISSESLILYFHDLPLLRLDNEFPKKNKLIFDIARFMQVLVNLSWVSTLIYMIIVLVNLDCKAQCNCPVIALPQIPQSFNASANLTCYTRYGNETVYLPYLSPTISVAVGNTTFFVNTSAASFPNCTETYSKLDCQKEHPSLSSCVLLGLVLLESLFQMGQMFFKSYIYPITVPEYVMFLAFWHSGDQVVLKSQKNQAILKSKIVDAVGRAEFGDGWKSFLEISDELKDPLLSSEEFSKPPSDESNVDLDHQ